VLFVGRFRIFAPPLEKRALDGAAEAIYEAKLRRREIARVVSFLRWIFVALYEMPMPKIGKRQLNIKEVLYARLTELKRSDDVLVSSLD